MEFRNVSWYDDSEWKFSVTIVVNAVNRKPHKLDVSEGRPAVGFLGKHAVTTDRIDLASMAITIRSRLWWNSDHVCRMASLTRAGAKLRDYTDDVEARLLDIDPTCRSICR